MKHLKTGLLIVISGPSGVGKSTIVHRLIERNPLLSRSVSATTRPPRTNEIDGQDYHFLSKSEFEKQIRTDGLIEWTEYNGNYYGTLRSTVTQTLNAGKDLILTIDVDGGMQVRKLGLRSVLIFVVPESFESLETRLHQRGTETIMQIRNRLRLAEAEIAYLSDYDFCLVNTEGKIDLTIEQIEAIITANRHRVDSETVLRIAKQFHEN